MFLTCAKEKVNNEHNGVGIKMVGQIKENVCTTYWVCVTLLLRLVTGF
jgi:hypothetical protein